MNSPLLLLNNPLPNRWPLNRAVLLALLAAVLILPPAAQPLSAQEGSGPPDEQGVTIHVVQAGESLAGIAARYAVSIDALRQANSLTGYDGITVGQRLIIPPSGEMLEPLSARVVIAGPGDTLITLAARYNVPVENLAALNRIAGSGLLYVGQPVSLPAAARTAGSGLVRIGPGESLWHVALRGDRNAVALMLRNGITNPHTVPAGRLLAVPGDDIPDSYLPEPWAALDLHPLPLEQGRSAGLRVETTFPGTLRVVFLGVEWPVASDGTSHRALIAVNRYTGAGLVPLTLTLEDGSGGVWTITRDVLIGDGGYRREQIRLPEEVAAVLNDPAVVAGENAYIQRVMTGFTPERYWEGLFRLPAAGVLTSGYGGLRSYNDGGFNTFHSGADLGGPVGTPITAPAGGVVVDTGLLDVRGYVTIIDHGWGVYTGYWHQSSILVQPGDRVEAGQQIGAIGNTGLSTAPHLHWEMWVNGVQVDPLQWVRVAFP